MINELAKRVADYLGVDDLPIEYNSNMPDDSRLVTEEKSKILINEKYKGNYIELAKCIAHEYRHAF